MALHNMPSKYTLQLGSNGDVDTRISPAVVEMELMVAQHTNSTGSLDSSSGNINPGFQHEMQGTDEGVHNQTAEEEERTSKETVTVTDGEEDTGHSAPCCVLFLWIRLLKTTLSQHSQVIGRCVGVVLLLAYLAYTGYALYRQWGTEAATRLLLLLLIVLWVTMGRHVLKAVIKRLPTCPLQQDKAVLLRNIARWGLYMVATVGAVVYIVLEVALHEPRNLISLAGIAFLLLVGLLLSTAPERVNWHAVFWGIALQFYLAIFLLRTSAGRDSFEWLGDRIEQFIANSDDGSRVLFGDAYTMHPFAFQTMPVVIFVNSFIAAAYYYGVIQAIIATFGRFLSMCLNTTAIESVSASSNLFLGVAEAPLLIKPFLIHMSESELFAVMTCGFASIAGAIMGTIIAFGVPANHLLAASVMSAPAALAIAKLVCPEDKAATIISSEEVYRVNIGRHSNLLEAMAKAALDGVSIVANICANILVFTAVLAFLNRSMEWFGDQAGVDNLSFSHLLAYLFYPLMYLCGVDSEDLLTMGRLVGVKTFTNTQLGYKQAADLITNSRAFEDYRHTTNGTWHYDGDDLILDGLNETLVGGVLTERSIVMSTYIMCGMSNITAIGITIGTLTALAPQRSREIIKHVVNACIAGNIANFLTGCVAGLLYV